MGIADLRKSILQYVRLKEKHLYGVFKCGTNTEKIPTTVGIGSRGEVLYKTMYRYRLVIRTRISSQQAEVLK